MRASATSSSKTTPMNDGVKKQGKDIADAAAEKVEVLLKVRRAQRRERLYSWPRPSADP